MSHYRKIDTRVWADRKFNALSEDAQLVFFRVLTHPNMTSIGGMRGSVAGLADEARWRPDRFRRAFAELVASGMVMNDQEALLICFPNFMRYNQPESPNVVRSWARPFDALPECPLRNMIARWAVASIEDKGEGFQKALPKAFLEATGQPPPKPYRNQEQEQEQELEDKNLSQEVSNSGVVGARLTAFPGGRP